MSNTQVKSQWRLISGVEPKMETGEQVFAIIEPLLWKTWETDLKTHIDPFKVFHLMKATRLSHLPGPVLVPLNGNDIAFRACVEAMAHAPCGCLIWSSSAYTGSEVALSLSQRIILPFGKGEAVFRFYEPRTLLPLMASLTDEERRQFLPLITHVKWFQKQWLGADIHISENTNINPHSRWELTQEQVSSMQNIAQQM